MSMQKFARAVVLAFCLGTAAIALGLFSTHPAGAAGSAPVTVTNTPLPIQGTVNAVQSSAWNVGISGTPSVNVAGLPAVQFNGTQPVTFSNAEANPIFTRDVDSAVRHPIVRFVCSDVGTPGSNCGSSTNFFTVPSGARLVIEQVDGTCTQYSGTNVTGVGIKIQADTPISGPEHSVPLPFHGNSSDALILNFSQLTRIYAEPETTVSARLIGSFVSPGSGAICQVTVSGYLVNQ